jgi:hypothetical protein
MKKNWMTFRESFLDTMADDGSIEIEYPDNSKIEDINNAEGEQIKDYWFGRTKKGCIEQQSIEFEPEDEDGN